MQNILSTNQHRGYKYTIYADDMSEKDYILTLTIPQHTLDNRNLYTSVEALLTAVGARQGAWMSLSPCESDNGSYKLSIIGKDVDRQSILGVFQEVSRLFPESIDDIVIPLDQDARVTNAVMRGNADEARIKEKLSVRLQWSNQKAAIDAIAAALNTAGIKATGTQVTGFLSSLQKKTRER